MRRLAVLYLALGLAPHALADAGGLALGDATRIALAHNPSIAAAQARLDAAREAARASRAEARRTWRLSAGASANGAQNVDPSFWYGYGEVTGEAARTLDDGGKASAAVRIAEAQQAQARAELDATMADVAEGVLVAWAGVREAEAQAASETEGLGLLGDHLRRAELRADSGDAPTLDVDRAQAAVAEAEANATEASARAASARRELARVLGSPLDANLGGLAAQPDDELAVLDLPSLLPVALERSPALRAQRAALAVAQAEREAARRTGRSEWELALGYTLGDDPTGARHLITAGVRWTGPTSSRTARSAREESATAAVTALEADLRAVEASEGKTVADLVDGVMSARSRLASLTRAAELSRRVHDKAQLGYDEGAIAMRDLLDARHDLTLAERDRVSAECALLVATGRLRRYGVGPELEEETRP